MEVTDEPTEEQRTIFADVQQKVRENVQPEDQFAATMATYTYRLAVAQGANMYEALALVYRSGAQHLNEAAALLHNAGGKPT